MTFADLFSGIGGFRLGLERARMQCAWACEIDDFCRHVYLKHWPETEPFYDDIRSITNPPRVDLVCGGFPCQPFSVAGKRAGTEDPRNLWPEMLRVVDLVRPSWVLGENVPGIGDYLDTVVSDLESRGFEVVPFEIEAAAVGAHHRRARVWIVAHATDQRSEKRYDEYSQSKQKRETNNALPFRSHVPNAASPRLEGPEPEGCVPGGRKGLSAECGSIRRLPESRLGRGFDGLPSWLDGSWEYGVPRVATGVKDRVNRLKSLGNAVVPQCVEWIGRRIMEADAGMVG